MQQTERGYDLSDDATHVRAEDEFVNGVKKGIEVAAEYELGEKGYTRQHLFSKQKLRDSQDG